MDGPLCVYLFASISICLYLWLILFVLLLPSTRDLFVIGSQVQVNRREN
jgi:hypothetical protein